MQKQTTYKAIGVMSGSSLDGLDIVYAQFKKINEKWSFKILSEALYPLEKFEEQLHSARKLPLEKLNALDISFGKFIGNCIQDFRIKNHLKVIDIIASHGHTVYHFPEKGITKQIGCKQAIFEQTNIPCLNNLRQKDIDFGGNGAPIVPIGDWHLFSEYKYCLNIGGIANISIKTANKILAFDICTANQVLNYLASSKNKKYDKGGQMAKQGKLNQNLLKALNSIPFYLQKLPKSLDNAFRLESIAILNQYAISIEDKLYTYCHHIAYQITECLSIESKTETMLVTGGGAFNHFLCTIIANYLKPLNINIKIPNKQLVENKEAMVMAFMGVLFLRKEVNCLASATGAKQDSICGEIYLG